MKTLILILSALAIFPWSLIIGFAILVYRRVRSQRQREAILKELTKVPAPSAPPTTYQETKEGWAVIDANHITKAGSA